MLPVRLCLRNGFDATKLYQLVYTVKDPYVLGAGTAAFRDVASFFRYQASDDFGTTNPLAGFAVPQCRRFASLVTIIENVVHHFFQQADVVADKGAGPFADGDRPL